MCSSVSGHNSSPEHGSSTSDCRSSQYLHFQQRCCECYGFLSYFYFVYSSSVSRLPTAVQIILWLSCQFFCSFFTCLGTIQNIIKTILLNNVRVPHVIVRDSCYLCEIYLKGDIGTVNSNGKGREMFKTIIYAYWIWIVLFGNWCFQNDFKTYGLHYKRRRRCKTNTIHYNLNRRVSWRFKTQCWRVI